MAEINQYIKELLILNDCVIIPGLGGFVANYKPASIENNRFFPPCKDISFNAKLNSNDGLLINFISESEKIDYFSAKQLLDYFVEETLMKLEHNSNVYFCGIGYLHYDSHENLIFEPKLQQNLLVDAYGLQDFSFEKLYQRQMPRPAFVLDHKEPIPIVFQQRKLKKLLIAVPLLVAMALIPMKNNQEYVSKSDMNLLETLFSSPTTPTAEDHQTANIETSEALVSEIQVKFNYYLIGGSFRSAENADKYLNQLKQQGFEGNNLGVFKGLHRIAIKGFSTKAEAQKELNSYLNQYPESGVWIAANE